jgi:anti-sigma regulatory factor (Ser/Thr protein kinase)
MAPVTGCATNPVGDAARLTRWDGVSEATLTLALSLPATRCVEVDLIEQYPQRKIHQAEPRSLGLAVTTKSAYRHPVARAFIAALAHRTPLSDELHDRIYTAVQEALMNAVMHGNLRIDSGSRDSLDKLSATHDAIEAMLASPQIARGIIRVEAIWSTTMLHVLVHDSGDGFERKQLPSPEAWHAAGHIGSGRGLTILEAICDRVALLDGGSTIKLSFDR